jgi:osmotically-inducible protein OsmY
MGSRYRNTEFGRREPRGEGRGEYRASFERGGFRDTDFGGRSDYGSEENYFGSGRQQYGSGYTGTGRSGRDSDDWYGDRARVSDEGLGSGPIRDRAFDDRERGSYRGRGTSGRRYATDEYGRDRQDYGFRDTGDEYYSGPTGGMYGGGFGGYAGGGYQGYTGEQNPGRYQRTERGNYGSDYPESERGYRTERGYGGSNREERGWWDRASDEVSSWFGDEEAERRRQMDERRGYSAQSHRGRGPRNYNRSDDRIREDVNDRLTDSHFIDASDIDVQVTNAEVILSGTVDSRHAKRMAEDIAEDVSGVKNVENRLRVDNERNRLGSTQTETSGYTGTGASAAGTSATGTAGSTGRSTSAPTGTTSGTSSPANVSDASRAAKTRGKAAGS